MVKNTGLSLCCVALKICYASCNNAVLPMPAAASTILPLKVKPETKLFRFLDWYETSNTTINPETGRKRKGNVKKFLIEELEEMLASGKPSSGFLKSIADFKQANVLPVELQAAKATLSETDFAKFVELMEKVKIGV